MDRIIPLGSVRNFRDFGDYETRFDRPVRRGRLFRSAHFSDVTSPDQERLEAFRLGLLVDLRHGPERQRQPNKEFLAEAMTVLELLERDNEAEVTYAPHEMFMKETLETSEDARQYMLGSYTARPQDPVFVDIFSRTLKFMAEQDDPLVIHCAAGKDRTGTLAAIIQKILGVSDEQILHDYMLTMEAVDVDSFLEPASAFLSKRFDRPISAESLRPMFGVEPDFLQASLGAMGDFDDYVERFLGISDNQKTEIRANYLQA